MIGDVIASPERSEWAWQSQVIIKHESASSPGPDALLGFETGFALLNQ